MPKIDFREIKKSVAEEIIRILITSIAGGSTFGSVLSSATGIAFSSISAGYESHQLFRFIKKVSYKVTNSILEEYKKDRQSYRTGTAISALHDFAVTLKNSNLSVEKIVDLDLDKTSLLKELLRNRPDYMASASYHRRQIFEDACERFVNYLIPFVPLAPEFQLIFSQKVIKQLNALKVELNKLSKL